MGAWPRSVLPGLGAAAALLACSLATSLDDFAQPVPDDRADGSSVLADGGIDPALDRDARARDPLDTDARASAGADASDAATAPECPSRGGPAPVRVPLASGGYFCIDSTEVTRAQYSEFLASRPAPSKHPRCGYKSSYTPSDSLVGNDLPVTGVDWCDAYELCAWAGKRLCGKIGGGVQSAVNAATLSEWVFACSGGGELEYPYGRIFDVAACVTAATEPAPVRSRATCEGGIAGVFDMSGNAAEWGAACDPSGVSGESDLCASFNSAFAESYGPDLKCTRVRTVARNARAAVGIRCCGP